jgi:tripartite ATP-independent transporter DctP family solute receptor
VCRRFIVAVLCVLSLGGCAARGNVTVIKLGHALDPSHPVHKAMEYMAKRLAEESGGKMRIDIYPSQQLGTERQLLELLQLGGLGMTKVSAAVLEGFAPAYKVLSLPYIFRDDEHRYKVLEGDIGRQILLQGQRYWLRGLTYYDAGSRSFYTKDKPIRKPGDLAGMKIRTMESATQIELVNDLGGSATPISFGELYTALQQGVVDGAENNPPSFLTSRHYEVCKYYSLDEHSSIPDVLLISTIVWNELTPQEQEWLQEAATESASYEKKLWQKASDEALKEVQAAGVEIIHPDKQLFADKVASMYDEYRSDSLMWNLIERIRAVQ